MDDVKTLKLDSEEYKHIKEIVLGPNIQWTYEPISSGPKFPFLCHNILGRSGQIFSPSAYKGCLNLVKDITSKLDVSFEKPLRMAVNYSFATTEPQADWHVDHPEIDHKVLLIYFNKTKLGNTMISENKYDKNKPVLPAYKPYPDKDIKIGKIIEPCEDTAVIFDGMRWHNAIFPEVGQRRITLVVTFI